MLHQVAQQVHGAAVGEEVETGGAGEVADQLLKFGIGAGAHEGATCKGGAQASTAPQPGTAMTRLVV